MKKLFSIIKNMRYRICTKCGDKLPATREYFYSDYRTKDRLQARCKTCHNKMTSQYYQNNIERIRAYKRKYKNKHKNRYKNQRLIRNYGITLEKYKQMFEQQNGKCAICNLKRKLHVDHDHATEKVRGLLCTSCNNGLGRFKDSPQFLKRAIKYLEETNE